MLMLLYLLWLQFQLHQLQLPPLQPWLQRQLQLQPRLLPTTDGGVVQARRLLGCRCKGYRIQPTTSAHQWLLGTPCAAQAESRMPRHNNPHHHPGQRSAKPPRIRQPLQRAAHPRSRPLATMRPQRRRTPARPRSSSGANVVGRRMRSCWIALAHTHRSGSSVASPGSVAVMTTPKRRTSAPMGGSSI